MEPLDVKNKRRRVMAGNGEENRGASQNCFTRIETVLVNKDLEILLIRCIMRDAAVSVF